MESLRKAKQAVERGEADLAFQLVREVLAESSWSAELVKASGDVLGTVAEVAIGESPALERIAVLGSCTTTTLLPAIRCALAEEGRLANIYDGPFGAFRQEILDSSSGLHAHRPDTVLIVRCWRDLVEAMPPAGASDAEVDSRLEALTAEATDLWSALEKRHSCRILQHDLEPPDLHFVGPAEHAHPASGSRFIGALDRRLRKAASGHVSWVEIADAARRVGSDRWSPPALYHLAKLPFNTAQLGLYARLVQGAWRIAANRTKKVLVTDLDNTLWGGIVGDDGLEGIALGPGSASGEGFQAFARYLRELQRRGVVLAVCSKNDPAIASRPFRDHPHMPLREEDFAVFHCSWSDKASGLREISQRLNLGLDSLVFVDDNPAECALVRRELPEVTTIHLVGEPSGFPAQVESRHLFDRNALTQEDLERGSMYRKRAEAEQLRETATDLEGYLASLDMSGHLTVAAATDIDRLAQLESKTNQFNTMTTRFSREDLEKFSASENHVVLSFRLRDRFTDHGLVSSVVLLITGDRLAILNWTLSCRVFSRGAEAFILNKILTLCRKLGKREIVGSYRPTPKNGVIAELYPSLGFVAGEQGSWVLPADSGDRPCHIADSGEGGAPS